MALATPPQRVLMGPGPSTVPADVLAALAAPTLGHLDPDYLAIMDETRDFLRRVFRTENPMTLAIPGTGSAGMETCLVNLLEPGDEAIVTVNGVFGTRLAEIARRCGAHVHRIELEWGETLSTDAAAEALEAHRGAKIFCLVHAETSTGAHQNLEEMGSLVHDAGALFVVDAVTSLGGIDVRVDDWGLDAVYSGTQKCLSCPPGLAPVTFSDRAMAALRARRQPVQSWYLDLSLLEQYWGQERSYHHTAPINMTYALRRALQRLFEEGLEASFERHRQLHRTLRDGLEGLGFRYIPSSSLPMLNALWVPEGVDEAKVRRRLLEEFNVEVGAGLGPFAGKALRIGLMGASCTRANVTLVLSALEQILEERG